MTHLGVVAILIGFLLADPVLCRSVEARGPCRGHRGVVHGPDSGHGQRPSDTCQGSVHGCVCQGATSTLSSKRLGELALSASMLPLLPGPWPDLLTVHAQPSSIIPSPRDADGLPVGRSLRIAYQSFQI